VGLHVIPGGRTIPGVGVGTGVGVGPGVGVEGWAGEDEPPHPERPAAIAAPRRTQAILRGNGAPSYGTTFRSSVQGRTPGGNPASRG
jgi:hypothetical protein